LIFPGWRRAAARNIWLFFATDSQANCKIHAWSFPAIPPWLGPFLAIGESQTAAKFMLTGIDKCQQLRKFGLDALI
jgi:hypothetical protein